MTDLQIQYFLKVADCMSFSGAARELFVSQPSISRQVKQLEKSLGYKLFDRSCKNSVELTPAGIIFRDSFHQLVREHKMALNAAWEISRHPIERLRIGVGENWDLTEPLMQFREKVLTLESNTELIFEQAPFLALRDKLLAGQLDAIICTQTCVQSFEGLELTPVGEMHTTLFADYRLLPEIKQIPDITDLGDQTLLMLPDEEAPMALQIVLLQFIARKMKPKVRRLPNRSSIWQAVRMREGFCIFDDYTFQRYDPSIYHIDLNEAIPICVVWKRQKQSPLLSILISELKRVLSPTESSR